MCCDGHTYRYTEELRKYERSQEDYEKDVNALMARYQLYGVNRLDHTGLSEVTGDEPPTYSAVGTSDGIASYTTMERRINAIKANGTDAMIEVFQGLPHGFGLGTGTAAEGWIENAVTFWERNMEQ